jgi:hypothetical protein
MNLFQLVFATLFLLSLLWCVVQLSRGRMRRVSGFIWVLVWATATMAVLRPELASRVAHLFGIGRGSDFVLYIAVILGLYLTATLYKHLRRLEIMVTELLRLRALDQASLGGEDKRRGETSQAERAAPGRRE